MREFYKYWINNMEVISLNDEDQVAFVTRYSAGHEDVISAISYEEALSVIDNGDYIEKLL